ncbi:MAG TPA: LamG domain-containing protein, partial [bacterium]|nr:LamG domain-containing protein [bacterium]
ATSTTLTVIVPPGVTAGPVTVSNTGGTATGPSFTPLPNNGVSFWKAEDSGLDGIAANTATAQNLATFAPGKLGRGFSFDGVDDHFTIPDDNSLDYNAATSFTLSMWVNPDVHVAKQRMFSKGSSGWSKGWHTALVAGGSTIIFELSDGIGAPGQSFNYAGGYTVNTWQHIVHVVDKSVPEIRLYTNGVFRQSFAITEGLDFSVNALPVHLGHNGEGPPHEYFDGRMDETHLFSRALSAAEVQQLYDAFK